ncbi:MAG TPA: LpqB family beta-propeller domain-containing protein [Actinomycetes bacterium]
MRSAPQAAERRSRWWRPAVLLLLAAVLPACASIPTSGPVRADRGLRVDREDVAVPFIAEGPVRGATVTQVVQGFLRASADFRRDHEVARRYLTPRARQEWRPAAGTTVHDSGGGPVTVEETGDGVVVAGASEIAHIDAEGSFRRTAGSPEVTRTFRMERVDGQWRIDALEDGLLLSMLDVEQTFRQVSLYFLSPLRNSLVPDTVLVPELPGLSTKVVSRLLRGPTAGLRGSVETAFPQGTELEVQSVPVDAGLAIVALDAQARRADQLQREQMSAQIVWTLKQLGPEIDRIRITAAGEDLAVSGVAADQGRDSWLTYDPDGLAAGPSLYAVRDGQFGRFIEGSFQPVDGPAGTGAVPLATPAVSLDTNRVAAVSTDGTTLRVGRLAEDGSLDVVVSGGDLSQPSWDPDGNLWVVDRSTGRLLLLPGGAGPAQTVELPRLPGGTPTQVSVSRDGARIALITGAGRSARLVLGAVTGVEELDADVPAVARIAVVDPREVLPDLRGVQDVAWADATTLAVLGSRDELPPAPFLTSIDGFDIVDVVPEPELATVAAAPPDAQASPLVVGTTDGELLQYTSGRGWVSLGEGIDPTYPG